MPDKRSHIEDSVEIYANIWKSFRDQPFGASALAKRLIERDEYELVAEEGEPEASLDKLVDYGLLETTGAEYQVAVEPNAAADELRSTESLRTAAVDRLIQSALVRTDEGSNSDERLSFEGEPYTVVELPPETTVSDGVEHVTETAADNEERGVAITTAGTNADRAQQIADRLTERTWEKVGTDVVGEDSSGLDLTFRLFLDRPSNR
ncbi:hypothetical protein [Halobacterium sp. R2-5]|uniref:hypothetical protein n=1 Tax=Halobacterium sp. R2-5 TaxID=2715751 RepID=UPI00142422A1|nr:hypothetical protein [Halobacterium sp. R2-5]NIC00872.1 hypothetical protein [Halobacterium sp. R2-5]